MIECGQIWTTKSNLKENVRITKIEYKINCIKFIWQEIECVSSISGFQMRYFYNAKLTNEEIIKNIIE